MSIVRGTTPTFELTFPNTVDFTTVDHIYVTFRKNGVAITKSGSEIQNSEHTITVALSQEETLQLGTGTIEIQVNWTFGGLRAASDIVPYQFDPQLLPEVLD